MAFCRKCGTEVLEGDEFCRACGTPVIDAAAAPPTTVAQPPAPSPSVEPAAQPPAGRRAMPVWVIVAIVVTALVVVAAGVGALMLLRGDGARVSSADPGSLGFDAVPFDPNAVPAKAGDTGFEEPAGTETTQTEVQPPAGAEAPTLEPVDQLSGDAARDVVGRMLQAMHDGDADAAMSVTTERMRKTVNNDRTWFGAGPDVVISFEIRDALVSDDSVKVQCLEQWNSGPEHTTYTVILKDGEVLVDFIEWGDL